MTSGSSASGSSANGRANANNGSNSARRVLVVDDDDDIRETIAAVLTDAGFCVEEAANGIDALARLRDSPHPDVMLLDLMMPLMDGWEVLRQRKEDQSLLQIPVVLLSAHPSLTHVGEGVSTYLRKPVELDVLLEAVRTA